MTVLGAHCANMSTGFVRIVRSIAARNAPQQSICALARNAPILHAMKLTDYIGKVGDKAFAESIGASRRAVTDWRLGNRIPRPAWAQKIVAAHKGKVSMAEIYGVAQ